MLLRKALLLSGVTVLLLLLTVSFVSADDNDRRPSEREPSRSRSRNRSTTTLGTPEDETTTRRSRRQKTTTYDYPHEPVDPSDKHHGKGRGRHDYDRSDEDDEYDGRSGGYGRPRVIGHDGQHPGEYGQDYADFGPVYGRQESMEASMNVWIRAADDWEQRGSSASRSRYPSKYNRKTKYRDDKKDREGDDKYKNRKDKVDGDGKNSDESDYKKGDRKKRSYSRVKFPVRQYKDIRRFPHKNFPPLISIFPWLPIFYDRVTYQTFIFSPTGGIYILPPLINFYGQRFAVAQLIKWGYASLVSSGAPPPPSVDVAPFVQPVPAGPAAGGPVAGGAGAAAAPGGSAPTYDTRKNRFNGGVRTEFPDFKPRYAEAFEETGYGNNRGANRNTYGTDSNYGGTGRQEVYEQGGARAGGSAGGSVRGSGGYNY